MNNPIIEEIVTIGGIASVFIIFIAIVVHEFWINRNKKN